MEYSNQTHKTLNQRAIVQLLALLDTPTDTKHCPKINVCQFEILTLQFQGSMLPLAGDKIRFNCSNRSKVRASLLQIDKITKLNIKVKICNR